MPNPDDPREPPSPPRPRAPPSLMTGAAAAPRAGANGDSAQVRMLAEFGSGDRPVVGAGTRSVSPRVVALLLAVIAVLAGAWWWNHSSAPPAEPRREVLAVPTPADNAASAASIAALAPQAASAAAVIETLPQAQAAASAPLAALAADNAASSPPQTEKTLVAVPASHPVPAAKVADKRVDKRANNHAAAPAAAARTAKITRDNTRVTDADVLLLSAMLAHVSRGGQGSALADQDQLTIAQVVKRCETRDVDEARECRRRICDGYWGKAQACPAGLAPKKN